MRVVVSGDCQAAGLAAMLSLAMPSENIAHVATSLLLPDEHIRLTELLADADVWVRQRIPQDEWALGQLRPGMRLLEHPSVRFLGFHADATVAVCRGQVLPSFSPYSSRIALWAWKQGMTPVEAEQLFTRSIFAKLGYFSQWDASARALVASYASTELNFGQVWGRLLRSGCFMHTFNHPKLTYQATLAKAVANALGVDVDWDEPLEDLVSDPNHLHVWPVYPAIGEYLGISGGYRWRNGDKIAHSLTEYLQETWAAYGDVDPRDVTSALPVSSDFEEMMSVAAKDVRRANR